LAFLVTPQGQPEVACPGRHRLACLETVFAIF
jgi:hypothetical protein